MKIATLLSVSAVLAMFSVVACSSPTTPATGDEEDNASSKGDDDDGDKADKTTDKTDKTTQTTQTNKGGDDTDTTAGNDGPSAAQKTCNTCMAGKEPKFKTALECAEKATSADAADKCFTDACGTTAGNVCAKAHDACSSECAAFDAEEEKDAEGPTKEETQKCLTCVSGNASAKAIVSCFAGAQSDADFKKCDDLDAKCDSGCQAAFKKCNAECGEGE
ncbi:MAG: hypothetical protein U0270_36035 [Labilithrix sp.]